MRKGQLEIGITMMVIIVFVILLIMSLVFYLRFSQEGIKNIREELLDSEYSVLLNTIMNMPEFKCSFEGIDKECLDAVKLNAFWKLINEDSEAEEYYNDVFVNVNKLEVEVVYPLDDYEEILVFGSGTEGKIYSIPIAVYYPEENGYKIGKLKIYTR